MRSWQRGIGCALGLLALGACGKEPTGKYNVVLISIDSLRADHTGPYGHKPEFAPAIPVTPNLDRLAQSGAVFEDAWTSSSWTLPCHMALMTGLTDRGHAVEHDEFMLDPLRRTLAEQFRADGYATGGCYSGPFLDPKYGFGRGFEEYVSGMLSPEEFAGLVQREAAARQRAGVPFGRREIDELRGRVSHEDVTSPRVNAFAREFLNQKKDERFFLFLHYFDAHYDYLPEQEDRALASSFDPEYRGRMDGSDWYFDKAKRVLTWQLTAADPPARRMINDRDLSHVLALYDAEIHWVDQHVGAVLDQIRDLGLEDETIVIVTADHGDEFFDHGSIAHRSTLAPELCHIPLLVRVPGAGHGGQRIAELARIYDLAPSLLDWCGLPPLPEAQGASLRPLLDGGSDERTALHRIYARFNRDRAGTQNVREAFRNENFTVLRFLEALDAQVSAAGMPFGPRAVPVYGRDFLVYDRVADPAETQPLKESDPRWQQAVEAFAAAWQACEAEVTAMPHSPMSERWCSDNTEDQAAELAALGYVNAPSAGGSRHVELLPFPKPGLPR